MALNRLKKIFGVGPLGALLSILLFLFFLILDRLLGHPAISTHATPLKIAGALLVTAGGALHLWSFLSLRKWWVDNQLCTSGPFKFFRHPMYAAWITFIVTGIGLYLNSWIMLLWPVSLQLLWPRLVAREEMMMADIFGDEYRLYANRTGRFIPKI